MVFTDQAATTQQDQVQNENVGETTEPVQESFLDKLVKTKGENWKNPEVLAKGKLEADGYIKNLEDQIAQMREDMSKQDYSAQILEKLEDKAAASATAQPQGSNNNGSVDPQNTTEGVDEVTLKGLVEKTLTEREQASRVQENLSRVDQELSNSFGTEAAAKVQEKAEELGMSMERLRDIAAESPSAFFALIGEPQKTLNPMVQGSVRTEGVNMQASAERDWSYYQKLRRENRNLYYSPKTQQQMFADQQRLGDKFGI